MTDNEITKKNVKKRNTSKIPFSIDVVLAMNNIKLSPDTFGRIARKFFKTRTFGNTVRLEKSSGKSVLIDFEHDKVNDYMKITFCTPSYLEFKYFDVEIKKVRYNRDLFIKLLNYKF